MLKRKNMSAYVSKHTSNCEKEVILLMVSNGEKPKGQQQWLYLALKNYQHYYEE